jgi:hypothetical protein
MSNLQKTGADKRMTTRSDRSSISAMGDEAKSRKKPKRADCQESEDSDEEVPCQNCGIKINKHSKALDCSYCHKWVCTPCLAISDDLYEMLVKNPTSPFLKATCKSCDDNVASIQGIKETLKNVHINKEETSKQLNSITAKVDNLNSELKATIKEVVSKEVE